MSHRPRALCFTSNVECETILSTSHAVYPISLMYLPLYIYRYIQTSNPCFITNKNGHILFVNEAWEKMTGHSCSALYKSNFSILQGEKTDHKKIRTFMRELCTNGHSSMNIINYNINKEEMHYTVESECIEPVLRLDDDENNQCHYFSKIILPSLYIE